MSDSLKLENQLCHRFYLLSNAFTRAYRPLLEKLDITYPQYLVLMALWEEDNVTIASLISKTGIDPGAMTLILKKLVTKSVISITKDEQDKRVKHVCLTDTGSKLQAQAEEIPAQMLCRFDGVGVEELREHIQFLDKLSACFGQN
ncbi:MarR family transcriptional regulator [Endozoicomonas sp. G2_1]|uniref:MarR family winged helix-turn-helix transcriptional regulator n=1 Tax=Endozoicomonas sp. G2_1 TaxID=2821091 RepID=UPI001ADCA031|nr:MarR family transcriptional regulator [Endozoicomonas sp. G2_1]MBO9489287.1 MarR family transcriptional regulator [Endozoicomonas sp. G2_1]